METIPWGDIVGISTPRDLFRSRCWDFKEPKKVVQTCREVGQVRQAMHKIFDLILNNPYQ